MTKIRQPKEFKELYNLWGTHHSFSFGKSFEYHRKNRVLKWAPKQSNNLNQLQEKCQLLSKNYRIKIDTFWFNICQLVSVAKKILCWVRYLLRIFGEFGGDIWFLKIQPGFIVQFQAWFWPVFGQRDSKFRLFEQDRVRFKYIP